ncbi:anhydro-N-acetylmuramic acid kinase, partial [Microcystis aeruginosa LEGE 00239]|uniref:anhydro-N-acetylmuramic acid kinase n=1 Tax=Microcystis aeruginosa TaxID=1126 RepID=UPI001880DAB1
EYKYSIYSLLCDAVALAGAHFVACLKLCFCLYHLLLFKMRIAATDEVGLNSDFKEAIAFALLAYWRWHNFPSNLPKVTGAKEEVLLGEIYL